MQNNFILNNNCVFTIYISSILCSTGYKSAYDHKYINHCSYTVHNPWGSEKKAVFSKNGCEWYLKSILWNEMRSFYATISNLIFVSLFITEIYILY